jgi:O-antigen ligase
VALVLTFSQSSLVALLAGLVVLAALRWSVRWTAVIAALAAIAALVYLVAFGSQIKFQLGSEKALDKTTSGRADLVRGGIELARRRPVLGFGSGSFVQSFRQESKRNSRVAASHTEPVTIAAEQGAVGIAVYLALLAAALTVLVGGLRGAMPDWLVARAAVAAAFVAMIVHSMTYAAFLTDPLTWALLAFAVVLSAGPLDSQLAPQPARRATGVAWLGPSRA